MNETPGGIGAAYHLMPDGTKFTRDATLTFHYDDSDVDGTNPYLMNIAFQDSTRQWRVDRFNREIDTLTKTISLSIPHFSVWSLVSEYKIRTEKPELKANDVTTLTVFNVIPASMSGDTTLPDGNLPSLPIETIVDAKKINHWKINGRTDQPANGTFGATGNPATYRSPAAVPRLKTIHVSVEVTLDKPVFNKKKKSNLTVVSIRIDLTLKPEILVYDVQYFVTQNGNAGGALNGKVGHYTDGFSFRVDVRDDEVRVYNIRNQLPSEVPSSGLLPDGKSHATWESDSTGMCNVVAAAGKFINQKTAIDVALTHEATHQSLWHVTSEGGNYNIGGWDVYGWPSGIAFLLKDSIQKTLAPDGNSTTIVTPVH